MSTADGAVPDRLRIVADVHGHADAFAACVADAARDGRFVVQLGDLVDRGPDSAGCLAIALDLVRRRTGTFLRGNHDDKLARCLTGNPVRVGPNLARTMAQIDARPDGGRLAVTFLAAFTRAPWWLRAGSLLLAHGAFHPAMLDHPGPDAIPERHTRDKAKWLALYAEGRRGADGDVPERTHGWVETVPAGLTVVVGHDVRAMDAPLVSVNAAGGRVVFLDTGCGKGGRLSWLDVDADGAEAFGMAPPQAAGSSNPT